MTACQFVTGLSLLTTAGAAATTEPNTALLIGSLALLAGAILIFMLEIFVPSGGILALVCAACIIASIVVMFMYNGTLGTLMLFGYIILIPFALYWGVRLWERSPIGRKLILGGDEEWKSSDTSIAESEAARIDRVSSIKDLIGKIGVTDSSLRPVGFIRVNGKRIDAISEGDMIEVDQRVKIVDAYDNQVKVRPVEEGENAPSGP